MTAQQHDVQQHNVQSAPITTSRWHRVRAGAIALAAYVGMGAAAVAVMTANGWPYGGI
ncbi:MULTISPECIES: hypothetical protein [Kribbella]|jgi:hypothetical protein|uniref:Uncharacterized protein n=1 Tax=Kribbella karoonensis TaxID=324851 RepID=A0ABN2EDE0_9ACTN